MPEPLSWSPLRRVRALDAELGAELGATLDQLSAAAAALIFDVDRIGIEIVEPHAYGSPHGRRDSFLPA